MKKLNKRVIVPVFALFVLIGTTSFKSDFFEIAKQIEIFTTLFKELNMNYEVTRYLLQKYYDIGILKKLNLRSHNLSI